MLCPRSQCLQPTSLLSQLPCPRPSQQLHTVYRPLVSNTLEFTRNTPSRKQQRCIATNAVPPPSENGNGNNNDDEAPIDPEELLKENPVLYELLFGEGSSGMPVDRPEDAPEEKLTSKDITDALQMGSWRLRASVCPQIQALVSQVEGAWRTILENDFKLYPLPEHLKYLDSIDPKGTKSMSYALPGPEKGEAGYPRLQIENRAYSSYAFRKLHIEVAVRQDGLQVFHCVMYPRIEFDLPILSMDVVAMEDRISFAIADPCPVSDNRSLPSVYLQPVKELQERYGVASNRGAPEWGKNIFSDLCVIMRPTKPEEVAAFLKYAIALSNFHVEIGRLARPVGGDGRTRRVTKIHAAHERYRENQLQNDKTRKVLEKSFGVELTEEYMSKMMFDVELLPFAP